MRDQTERGGRQARFRPLSLTLGVFSGMGLAAGMSCLPQDDPARPEPGQAVVSGAHKTPSRQAAWSALRPRLEKAERDSNAALARALTQVNDYISQCKQGAKPFADAVLGFEGKVAVADTQVDKAITFFSGLFDTGPPKDNYFTIRLEGDGLSQFVKRRFDQLVVDRWELQKIVQSAIAGYVGEVQVIENRLLVEIRADLGDDALAEVIPELRADALLHARYDALLSDVAGASSTDLNVTIARETVSWVGGDIATVATLRIAGAIATELGISGGVLSAGAGSSVATLGVGLVVSWIVDQILGEIMRLAGYDAKGEIVAKVEAAVEQTRNLVLDGSIDASWQATDGNGRGGQPGLRGELHRLHEVRARLRNDALKKLILGGAL